MPGIKSVVIPEDVVIKNPINSEELPLKYTFAEFCHLFLNLDLFKDSITNLKSALYLSNVFSKSKPGEVVELNSDDLAKLINCISENFSKTLNNSPLILMQLLPYLDTLINAVEVVK
jgi:hypothetical protein